MDIKLKLRLEVKGVEIELTPEDAKGLRDALDKLVGEKRTEYVPSWWPNFTWPWPYTYVTTTPVTWGNTWTAKVASTGDNVVTWLY